MSLKLSQSFSLFRVGSWFEEKKAELNNNSSSSAKHQFSPSLKIQLDREIYRPGDSVIATIEISTPSSSDHYANDRTTSKDRDTGCSFLVENVTFELKGIEKLDTQWFAQRKPLPGSKQKRGEHLFLDSTAPSILSKVIVSSGCTKTYIVRAELPKIIPPSYRGTSIRYIYYVRSTLCGRWLALENGFIGRQSVDDLIQLEARAPVQIWVTQNCSSLLKEGSLSATSVQIDIHWKEKRADSEWARVNEFSDGFEEGYDSSRDEVSSVSSYNPTKGNNDLVLRKSLSLQSMASRLSNSELQYSQKDHSNFPSYMPLTQLSVSEVIDDAGGGSVSSRRKVNDSSSDNSLTQLRKFPNCPFPMDDKGSPCASESREPVASESFARGRSYNIRIDDQVLLRFTPKNSDSTYYFGDTIGGTLNFFHGGFRRCLEVSITLETSETISQRSVHPSRRSSPTITKVHSDHYEVVADLVQSSFIFSIPLDGPMSFSTPHISVQWLLRFEFFTTTKGTDLNRYEHPLLIEEREKGDWVLPLTVCAPPPRTQAAQGRSEKPLFSENMFHT